MASRPIFQPHPVITDGDMSLDIISEVSVITNISMMSYSYTWVGTTPVGVISVEVSDDFSQNVDGSVRNPGTWNEIPLSSVPTVSGNSGQGFIDIDQLGAQAIRTVYSSTSGTGALQAVYKGKVS